MPLHPKVGVPSRPGDHGMCGCGHCERIVGRLVPDRHCGYSVTHRPRHGRRHAEEAPHPGSHGFEPDSSLPFHRLFRYYGLRTGVPKTPLCVD